MFLRFFFIAALIFSTGGFAVDPGGFRLSQLPDGYPQGRTEAPPGSYSTSYSVHKNFAHAVEDLEKKVYGLALISKYDEVEQAKTAYYLETLTIALLQKFSKEPANFETESLQSKLRDIYGKVRLFQERLFETMVRRVDVALPGPNGLQLRDERPGEFDVFYGCNCRKDSVPTAQEQADYYKKKLKDFTDAGGSLSEMHKFDDAYIKSLRSFTHLEYVERENGEIWVTEGKAGHVVLAEGKQVKAAGQIVVVKGSDGTVQLFIASNASGTYKPDLLSIKKMLSRVEKNTGIDRNRMHVTVGDPMGTQTVAILMKAKGVDSKVIKEEIKRMEAEAKNILSFPQSYISNYVSLETATVDSPKKCAHALVKLTSSTVPQLSLTYSSK